MSETSLPGPADYQQAAAAAGRSVPYDSAAAQAVGQVVQPDAAGGTDAGDTIDQIRAQVTRDVLLPMESKIEEMMAAAKSQQDALQKQVAQLQAQLSTTQAQVGPPAYQLYADSLAQRVKSMQASNPQADLAPAIQTAAKLSAAAKDVAGGKADASALARLSAPLEAHFARVVPHLEGSGTVLAELAHLAAEAAKIAA